MFAELQNKLDSVIYPSNYHYDIATLTPKGILKRRVARLKQFAPELFQKTTSFLDIGCSLGYFLFYHTSLGANATGIDKDLAMAKLVANARGFKVQLFDGTFKDFDSEKIFETVFLGNVFHYLYKEGGWGVVSKIARLCGKYCIVESPVDRRYFVKHDKHGRMDLGHTSYSLDDYTWENFLKYFGEFFDLIRTGDSFCPGRKIVVLKKRN